MLGRRSRWVLVGLSMVAVAVALLAVPARGYLSQRQTVSDRRVELAELERRNAELVAQRERLDDPEEIQRLARREYGLVDPGEESYSILPPPTAGVTLPRGWPFDRISGPFERAATGGS